VGALGDSGSRNRGGIPAEGHDLSERVLLTRTDTF